MTSTGAGPLPAPIGRTTNTTVFGGSMSKPSSSATIQITLTSRNGWVTPPHPMSEHGGLHPVPHGVCVLLQVGDAHHLPAHTAHQLAGALGNADHIDIVGSDYRVKGIRAALDRALQGLEPPAEQGNDPWSAEEGGQ